MRPIDTVDVAVYMFPIQDTQIDILGSSVQFPIKVAISRTLQHSVERWLSALNKHLMMACFSKSVSAISKLSRCI